MAVLRLVGAPSISSAHLSNCTAANTQIVVLMCSLDSRVQRREGELYLSHQHAILSSRVSIHTPKRRITLFTDLVETIS